MSRQPTSKVRGQLWDLVFVSDPVDWNPGVLGRGDVVLIDLPLPTLLSPQLYLDDARQFSPYRQPVVPEGSLFLKIP